MMSCKTLRFYVILLFKPNPLFNMNASRRDVLKMAGVALAGSALPAITILNPNKVFCRN